MSRCLHILISAACLSGATLGSAAEAQPARNVVLVHGAFADGSGWKGVYDRLTSKGYRVTIVQQPETGLDADVEATRRAVAMQDGPVVLVGHSWGGQVISEAGTDPKVAALVFVAAAVPEVGETVKSLNERMPPRELAVRNVGGYLMLDPAHYHAQFAADLPKAQADFMAHSQVLIAAKAFEEPAKAAAWRTKPSYGIVAGSDRTLRPELERWMYARAKATVTEVPGSSHAVYLSHPDVVAAVIEKAAGRR